jgi:hypothetical protein
MIAYELLEKLLSARDEKNLCQREELRQRHPVRPNFVWVGASSKFKKK